MANAVRLEGQCKSAPSVISGRKVFQVNVRLPEGTQAGQVHALAKSMDLSRPEQVSLETWQALSRQSGSVPARALAS